MKKEGLANIAIKNSLGLVTEIAPIFMDRHDAGVQLADLLIQQRYSNPVLLAIPIGGVFTAVPIRDRLGIPLHLVFASKVSFASDTRFGIGSVTSRSTVLNQDVIDFFELGGTLIDKQVQEAKDRVERTTNDLKDCVAPIPSLNGKTALLIDDGISTGYTILGVIAVLKEFNPERILVASPVVSKSAGERLAVNGIEYVVVQESSVHGFLVDNFYHNFPTNSVSEVQLAIGGKWKNH